MGDRKTISVLLVDDHMVVRKGLRLVLEEAQDISVVGEAESGEEALYLCSKLKPDIILMDVKMNGLGGTDATRLITQHHCGAKVIGLSTFANKDIVSGLFDAGASGYLLKDVSATNLIEAIWRVYHGETVVPETYSELPDEPEVSHQTSQAEAEYIPLGDQQKRVLALMTKGLTNPEIAEQVDISISTVRYHVSAILRKLDVSNRSEATALAIRQELVSSDNI